MKAYIQTDKEGEFYNVNAFVAHVGFKSLGYEIVRFNNAEEINNPDREAITVGGVGNVRRRLLDLGVQLPDQELEYPEELQSYLGRKIWSSTLKAVFEDETQRNIFIKPKETKSFNGKVLREFNDFIGLDLQAEVWCSEVVNLVTEWRCFFRYGKVLDIRRYKGLWDKAIDLNIVEAAAKDFTSGPAAYSLDFGVDAEGKFYLVEVNDGHSLGTYGIGAISYAKFLSARWAELTGTEDYLHF